MTEKITEKRKVSLGSNGVEKIPNRKNIDTPQQGRIRIKTWVFVLMIIIAVILDIASLFPVASDVTDVIAGVLFGLWWWYLGLGFLNLKKITTYVATIIIEAIPVASVLPMITVVVIVTFVISRTEDKLGISLPLSGKFKAAPISKARKMGIKDKVNYLAESNKRDVLIKNRGQENIRIQARRKTIS